MLLCVYVIMFYIINQGQILDENILKDRLYIVYIILYALINTVTIDSLVSVSAISIPSTNVYPMELCGVNEYEYCINVDIYPKSNESSIHDVIIQNIDDAESTIFHIEYSVINYNECFLPKLSFEFERIDYDDSGEYIQIFDNTSISDNLIAKCGPVSRECNEFQTCLNHTSIGIDSIGINQSHIFTIIESKHVDAYCESYHELSINARLSLICSDPISIVPDISTTTSVSSTATTLPTTTTTASFIPTQTPTESSYFRFICYYDDDDEFIRNHLSYDEYALLMKEMILVSLETITYQYVRYEKVMYNDLTPWKKAGISQFDICAVFDSILSPDDMDECALDNEYDENIDSSYQYIAIGMFEIIALHHLQEYTEWIFDIIRSDNFKTKFSENMNIKINNITSHERRRRNLIEYDSFEAKMIEIKSPLNLTVINEVINDENDSDSMEYNLSSTEYINYNVFKIEPTLPDHSDRKNPFLMVIIGFCCVLFIVILTVIASFAKNKQREQKRKKVAITDDSPVKKKHTEQRLYAHVEINNNSGQEQEYILPLQPGKGDIKDEIQHETKAEIVEQKEKKEKKEKKQKKPKKEKKGQKQQNEQITNDIINVIDDIIDEEEEMKIHVAMNKKVKQLGIATLDDVFAIIDEMNGEEEDINVELDLDSEMNEVIVSNGIRVNELVSKPPSSIISSTYGTYGAYSTNGTTGTYSTYGIYTHQN